VTFTLTAQHLGYYDAGMRYAMHRGTVEISVGGSKVA
jgi:hypothetical protein